MFYKIVLKLLKFYLVVFNCWIIQGKENIPREGPVVLVANHVSYWDPVILASSVNRVVHFMAKEELFKVPVFGTIIRLLHAFPIKRGRPDRNALRMTTEILQKGDVLALFPEGTRNKTGELLPFHPGAALFALRAKAPIIPMVISGSRTTFPLSLRGKIIVNIGRPFYYTDLYEQKISAEDLDKVTSEIREEMNRLLKDVHRK